MENKLRSLDYVLIIFQLIFFIVVFCLASMAMGRSGDLGSALGIYAFLHTLGLERKMRMTKEQHNAKDNTKI